MHSFKFDFVLQGVCALLFVSCVAGSLPNDIKKCNAGDGQCIIQNINTIFGKKNQGDETFGLAKMEPFKMDDIIVKQDPMSPVGIFLALRNPIVHGVDGIRAIKVKGFGKTPNGRHEIILESPFLTQLSDYQIDGKVLILPVKGEGKSNITLIEPRMRVRIDATSRTENGNIFMDIKKLRVECQPKRVIMHFGNLFNGDKILGDNINSFVNENWKEIYDEMKRPWYVSIAKQTKEGAESVFKKTPYNEIFQI